MVTPRPRLYWIFALAMCIFLPGATLTHAEPDASRTVVLSTPEGELVFTEYLRALYRTLGENTGLDFEIQELPKQRALTEADLGRVDGLAARIEGLQTKGLPNIRQVDASVFTVHHVLFAKDQTVLKQLSKADDVFKLIQTEGLLIGYLRGSKKAQALLQGIPDDQKKEFVTPEQAFKLLQNHRLDVFLGGPGIVSRAILKSHFADSAIEEAVVVSETKLFPYLHKSRADLIPRIEAGLQQLHQNGTLSRLRHAIER